MLCVKVHCGSAHVSGSARRYPYYVASIFRSAVTADGRSVWKNTGTTTYPRRSMKLAIEDGKALAERNGAEFIDGYGSLHNQPCEVSASAVSI